MSGPYHGGQARPLTRIIHRRATAVSAVLPWLNRQIWSTADTAVAREYLPDDGPMNNPG